MVSDVFLLEIGRVTAYFAFLETVLETVVWSLMFENDFKAWRMGGAATSLMRFARKVDLFQALALYRFGESETLTRLLSRLRQINTDRNRIVHALWYGNEPDKPALQVRVLSAKDRLELASSSRSIDEFQAVAREINAIANDLGAYVGEVGKPLPTKPHPKE
jgi:hypothetical protein